jgi:beta-glucanase (GH16 family)
MGDRIHEGAYRLTWSDEFDGAPGTLADSRTWKAETGGSGADLNGKPWVFDHDFFLLVNIAVGGTASVPPGKSVTFPQTMLIDYIRVYEPAARLA